MKELSLDLSPNLAYDVLKPILCSPEPSQLSALKVRILKFFDNHGRDEDDPIEEDQSQILDKNKAKNLYLKSLEYTHYAFDNSSYRFPVSWKYIFGKFSRIKVLRRCIRCIA